MAQEHSAEVTHPDIVHGLRELGIEAGDNLMVHASLKSFGRVTGGAITVIQALQEVLTPAGTLLLPTFNHGDPFQENGIGFFDPTDTPTRNGAIPDLFWRLPNVSRSLNPTHPFAARGRQARRYTRHHHRTLTMGPDSPLGRLLADDGTVLLLGVNYRANTFHHVVEAFLKVPCLGRRTEEYPIRLADGRQVMGRTWGWRAKGCPLTRGGCYGSEMTERGLEREVQIGSSRAVRFRLQDCFELLTDIFTTGRDGHPPCSRCPVRPRKVAATVPSDWDDESGRLKPDSPSWHW